MNQRRREDEEQFFEEIAEKLDVIETRREYLVNGQKGYKVECPKCKCKSAGFGVSKHGDTYILMCGRTECGYRKNLNQLINESSNEELKKQWWELSFGPRPSEKDPQWNGIKNRRKPGPKKQRKKTSDQDVPQMSERDLWRAAKSGAYTGEYIDPNHPLVRKLMRKKKKGDG